MRLLLLVIVFLTSCNDVHRISQKERLSNSISKTVAIQLRNEKELYACGSGGQMMDEIKMLALSFNYYKTINLDEARELLVSATNKFVEAVNVNKQIRPYLDNFPFSPKNIEIRIFVQNLDGLPIEQDQLCVVSMIEGILNYKMNDRQTGMLTTIYKESYEEALAKIHSPNR